MDKQTELLGLGIAGIIVALLIAQGILVKMFQAIATSRWPGIDGKIESAGVSESTDYLGPNASQRNIYRVVIRYSYQVGGRSYAGEKTSPKGQYNTSFTAAQRAANRYANQKTIKVYVSPEDSAQSTISMGSNWRYMPGLIVSISLLGVGVILLLASFGIHIHAVETVHSRIEEYLRLLKL